MVFYKKRNLGRRIEEINTGEKLHLTQRIEDKDLLLYLGLTNDSNPLYIQHDYASQTPYERPIVPSIMLTGIISSAVSRYLPGPGSHILSQTLEFIKPVYHYEFIEFLFEVMDVNERNQIVNISVVGKNEKGETVIQGKLNVSPPCRLAGLEAKVLENL